MAKITAQVAGGVDVVKMLDCIAWTEGTSTARLTINDGYDVIVTGVNGPSVFTDYSTHPFANGRRPVTIVKPGFRFPHGLNSDAAGRYQILLVNWTFYRSKLNLPDFSPLSQDLLAIQLLRERGALAHLENGNIELALAAAHEPTDLELATEEVSNIWASLPGNRYGQGGKSMADVVAHFETLA